MATNKKLKTHSRELNNHIAVYLTEMHMSDDNWE